MSQPPFILIFCEAWIVFIRKLVNIDGGEKSEKITKSSKNYENKKKPVSIGFAVQHFNGDGAIHSYN